MGNSRDWLVNVAQAFAWVARDFDIPISNRTGTATSSSSEIDAASLLATIRFTFGQTALTETSVLTSPVGGDA